MGRISDPLFSGVLHLISIIKYLFEKVFDLCWVSWLVGQRESQGVFSLPAIFNSSSISRPVVVNNLYEMEHFQK